MLTTSSSAALAAQQLGKQDLSPWLERAWRSSPSLPRLRRWLGTAASKQTLRKRATQALEAGLQQAQRQRALLHVLLGDFETATARQQRRAGGRLRPAFRTTPAQAPHAQIPYPAWGPEGILKQEVEPEFPHRP